jgi:hypothetical protein
MSDHTIVLTVILDKNYHINNAQNIMNAIGMIKGVASVKANVTNLETHTAYARARSDLEQRLWDVLKDKE